MNHVEAVNAATSRIDRVDRVDASTESIAAYAPVTLADLDATAALQKRRDRKYVLAPDSGATLLDHLARLGSRRVLEIDGRRSFRYESLYFDTDDLAFYRAAVQRRRHRAKVRIRRYVDTGAVFLEVKLRDRRGMQQKYRMGIDEVATRLDVDMRRFVDQLVGEVGLARTLRPTAITRYRRVTLLHDSTATRATFDTGLTCFDVRPRPAGQAAPAVALPAMIVESKSGSVATDLDRHLWATGERPVKISKYCTGLAALDPELPSNRWNRTLRNHFHAT
ncbi:MAG: polyphosphate polymerase domain-containing protein [Actinomycetota bacterium]